MKKLESIKKQLIDDFEKIVNDFCYKYYCSFNTTSQSRTEKALMKKEEQFKLLRKAINDLREKQSYLELNATNKEIEIIDTLLIKAEDFCTSCKGFIELREVLLESTKKERRLLFDAYGVGWDDYIDLIYYCHNLKGIPTTKDEINEWTPEWFDFGIMD